MKDYLENLVELPEDERITEKELTEFYNLVDFDVYDLVFDDDTETNGEFLTAAKYDTIRIGLILAKEYGLTLDDIIGYKIEDDFFRTIYYGVIILGASGNDTEYNKSIILARQLIELRGDL